MLRRAKCGGKCQLCYGSCKNITWTAAQRRQNRRPEPRKILIRIRMLRKRRRDSFLLLFARRPRARLRADSSGDPRGACSKAGDSSRNCVARPRKECSRRPQSPSVKQIGLQQSECASARRAYPTAARGSNRFRVDRIAFCATERQHVARNTWPTAKSSARITKAKMAARRRQTPTPFDAECALVSARPRHRARINRSPPRGCVQGYCPAIFAPLRHIENTYMFRKVCG
jgi:hypothetical protein